MQTSSLLMLFVSFGDFETVRIPNQFCQSPAWWLQPGIAQRDFSKNALHVNRHALLLCLYDHHCSSHPRYPCLRDLKLFGFSFMDVLGASDTSEMPSVFVKRLQHDSSIFRCFVSICQTLAESFDLQRVLLEDPSCIQPLACHSVNG